MKKEILLLLCLLAFFTNAQDPFFVNKQSSLVYLNPSFAGSNGFIRNQTVYRNQWPNLSGTYVTYHNTLDAYIKPIKGGLALSVTSDDVARGTLRTTIIAFSYAQYLALSEDLKIIPSVQFSYNQKTLDKGRLNFGDPIDIRAGQMWTAFGYVPMSSRKYNDIAAGVLMDYKGVFLGVSCANLLEPNVSLYRELQYKLPIRTVAHASWNLFFGPRHMSNFQCVFTTQGRYQQLSLRIINTFNQWLLYGLGYGVNDNFQAFLGLRKNAFTIYYSYDVNVSKLSGNPAGSHELAISWSFKKKDESYKKYLEQR